MSARPSDVYNWYGMTVAYSMVDALRHAGRNLTRQSFIYSTEHASVHTGVYPDLKFSPDDHFGADQVQVLKNVCQPRGNQAGYYKTIYAFKSAF